jgi:hypothetical protein
MFPANDREDGRVGEKALPIGATHLTALSSKRSICLTVGIVP